jgi:hypothetical protein
MSVQASSGAANEGCEDPGMIGVRFFLRASILYLPAISCMTIVLSDRSESGSASLSRKGFWTGTRPEKFVYLV